MGATRIVIYAEGGGETSGIAESALLPTQPTFPLPDDEQGPAHILIRRSVAHVSDRPERSIQFDAPLRLRGRLARGSDLLAEKNLKMLLRWPRPDRAPNLAIVLVDCDGQRNRKARLEKVVSASSQGVERIVAMSIQEFEAWLVADISTVNQVLSTDLGEARDPEGMNPGEAKELLKSWIRHEAKKVNEGQARCGIARNLDLDSLANRCPGFEVFLSELKAALARMA